ncbi:MAG: extracellular solute-binding protein, partial [Caldisericia bacterium]|nr:extracellular solute-binding protein [Caldisericia bacterium]
MKKTLWWLLIVLLTASIIETFSLAGCKGVEKTEVSNKEETVAVEATAPDEESLTEEPAEEFTLYVISHREFSEALMELMDTLDNEFESAHPGVTVQRDFMSFTDWSKVSELRLTGDNPPDIFVANNGEAGMGLMVRSGLLLDLTPYAEEFGWFDKIDQGLLNSMSYTADGKVFGEGKLYGMAPLSEEVGVYYNKQKFSEAGAIVPNTYEEFISLIEMFKEKGETPFMLGNIEGWPATHVLGEILFSLLDREDKQWRDDYVYAKNDVSFNRPETVQAATEFVNWIKKGYFLDGFEGIAYTDSIAEFAGGKGVMYIGGTWIANTMKDFVDINN